MSLFIRPVPDFRFIKTEYLVPKVYIFIVKLVPSKIKMNVNNFDWIDTEESRIRH